MARRLILVCAVALATAPAAWAHAIVTGTDPPNGAVLPSAPTTVTVSFDDPVRVGGRNAAIRNDDGADVIAGTPVVRQSRTLVIPLKPSLRDGNYTVRWSIVSDDGHQEEGLIAFGIGAGGGTPTAALGARGSVTWQQVVMRFAFFLGVLAAAGATFFALVVLRRLETGTETERRHQLLLGASFLLVFVGADALIHETLGTATRFERVLDVAAVASVIGAAAIVVALWLPRAIWVAWAASAVLLVCPTLAGHALDDDQPRFLAPLADLLHVGAAAVWLGGLASLVFVVIREPEPTRAAASRRFSEYALPLVVLLGAAGVSRALTQLTSPSQLWETSYGRTILVKSGLFLVLVVLGWLNRRGLAAGLARLRRVALPELLVLLVVVVAVATLTDLRPGSARATTSRAPTGTEPVPERTPPPAPPRGAFVDAAQAGSLAVGFAYRYGVATVTLVERDGGGASDTPVTIDGREPSGCGAGCFVLAVPRRQVAVTVGGRHLRFAVPSTLHPAQAEVERLRGDYDALASVAVRERISSGPANVVVTRSLEQAPDETAYRVIAATDPTLVGSEGILIGVRRWDRLPGGDWVASPQIPLPVPSAAWTSRARNAYFVTGDEITFYDPTFPAWFRVRFDPATGHVVALRMLAAGHFMTDAYSERDVPVSISPPPDR